MIKLTAIPALFVTSLLLFSCSQTDRKVDNLSNLSVGFEDEVELMKVDEPEPKKQIATKSLETKKPEPAKIEEIKEVKFTVKSDVPPQPEFIKKFNARYLNFDVADFFLQLKKVDENKDAVKYQLRLFTRTNGFIDYLFGWRDHSISRFKETKNKFVPEFFKTKLLFKKKIREITTAYDAEGVNIVKESVNPPDNRAKRPAVPDNLKHHTYDPLSVAMEARKMAIRAVKENNFTAKGTYNFSLPVYEGRRRTDLIFNLYSKKVDGNYLLKLTRKPVAGFTNNEITDIKKGDVTIDIYLDPVNFIPVRAEGRNFLGTASIVFVEDCGVSFEECVEKGQKK